MTWLGKAVDALAFVYALLFFPAPFFWLIIHPAIHFWRRFGNRSFWVALPVWAAGAVGLSALAPQLYASRVPRSLFTASLGALLVVAGLAIGRHVHRVFGLRRLGGLPEMNPGRYPGGVVRTGVYAWVRHPRYVEYMITFLGWALLTGAVGIFALAIVTILMYSIVASLEERELREQYGEEYASYAGAVPRFVPHWPRRRRLPERPGGANLG
ncbi:MAG TPA: isoprenylcysteine carboxylmethyltransferase family protein [Terriglobia bacterium]